MVHFRCFKRAKRTNDLQKSCDAGIVLELSRELMHAEPFLPPLWGQVQLFGEVICSARVNDDIHNSPAILWFPCRMLVTDRE